MACVRMMRSMLALQPNLEVTSAHGESVNLCRRWDVQQVISRWVEHSEGKASMNRVVRM